MALAHIMICHMTTVAYAFLCYSLWTFCSFAPPPPPPVNETLKWLLSLPILMQKSLWCWQCSIRYRYSHPPPPPPTPTHTHTYFRVVYTRLRDRSSFLPLYYRRSFLDSDYTYIFFSVLRRISEIRAYVFLDDIY